MFKNQFLRAAIRLFGRFIAVTVLGWAIMVMYMFINHSHSVPPVKLVMPAWVPFWPAFTLPYLSLLFVSWLLPLAIRDAALFRGCLWALFCAYLLVLPWWILTPTTLPRPSAPAGWGMGPYLWLAAIDPPNNVFPCAHGIGPVVAAWFVQREKPKWRGPLVVMLVMGLPSIALVWQHRPIDILLGTVAAAFGIVAGEALCRREQARHGLKSVFRIPHVDGTTNSSYR